MDADTWIQMLDLVEQFEASAKEQEELSKKQWSQHSLTGVLAYRDASRQAQGARMAYNACAEALRNLATSKPIL